MNAPVATPPAEGSLWNGWWLAIGGAAAAVACGGAAVVSPALAVAAAMALVFAAVAFQSLAAGVAIFAALTFFERIPGAAEATVPVGRLGIVVLVLAALNRSGTPLLSRERPFTAFVAAFFAVWTAASALWAADQSAAAAEAVRLASGPALVFVVFAAIRHERHVRWILGGYVAGAAVSTLIGIGNVGVEPLARDPGRLVGATGDANAYAAFLVPALVFAAFGLPEARAVATRWLLHAAVAALAVGLFLSQSRGGLVALAATLALALALGGRLRRHVVVLILLVSAAFATYFTTLPPESRERLIHFTSGGGTGRVDLWSVAAEVARDHPVVGVGAGNFRIVEPTYASETINLPNVTHIIDRPLVAHNTYLELVAELGIVGLVAFGVFVLSAFVAARSAIVACARSGAYEGELLARAVVLGTLGLLVAFIFISGQAKEQLWVLLGLMIALPSVMPAGRPPTLRALTPHAAGGPSAGAAAAGARRVT